MSKLFKSKILLGLALLVAVVFANTADAAITKTLRQGMRDAQVVELQQYLNANGFTVSTTGAGAPGAETSYFGSKTKTAVMAFQASKGLTADGVVGPMTRAAMTGTTTTTTFPAGCTSASGFSTTTGLPCSGGTTTTLPAGCMAGYMYSSTTGLPCTGTTTTTQTGPVQAMLAPTNPASTTVVQTQATAKLADFAFTGSGTVTNVTLKRIGVSADSTLSNVYLFDGATRLTDAASVSNNGQITFNVPAGVFTVNGSRTISVRSDIANNTSGQTVGVELVSFTTASGVTTVNLMGNLHTVANPGTLASVSAGSITPSGAILNPGANVTVWQSTLTVGTRDVHMKRVAFRNIGSAPASAFANFKLFVNGVEVGTAAGLDANGFVTFDLMSNPVNLQSGSRILRLDADIVSGASRTVQFSIRNAADVDFMDTNFGVNITPVSAPWTATASTISGSQGGTMTVEKDTTSPSVSVANGGNDVLLGVFKLTAFGEPIKVETLTASMDSSDVAVTSLRNARLLIAGTQYGSTVSLTTPGVSFTTNYTVNPGTPVMVEVRADIFDNDGTNNLTAGDTITVSLLTGASNAQKVDSLGSLNVPTAQVDGNAVAVATSTVSVVKNGTYANQNVAIPATAFKIGSWNLTGSSVEDVLLTTLSFDITGAVDTFEAADLTNMYAVVKSGATTVATTTPLATVAGDDNNFSINYTLVKNGAVTVELFANIGSTITTNDVLATDLSVSGTALTGGNSVAVNDVAGQTITAATASITATLDASTPVAAIAHDNQTIHASAFKFDAVTATYTVTDVTVALAGTNAATVVQTVELYDGATLVATRPGGAASITFNGLSWVIPANTNKVLNVKLVLGGVGIGAGSSGANVKADISAYTAVNGSTGISAAGTGTPTGNPMYVYAATPTITNVALPVTTLTTGTNVVSKFSIASNGGTIGWKKMIFNVTRSIGGTDTLSGTALWDMSTNTEVAGAFTYTGTPSIEADNGVAGTIIFVAINEQQISGSKTYELRTNIAGTLATGNNINVNITQPSTNAAPNDYSTVAGTTATFVWTDVSATSHSESTLDWNNGLYVKNLPTSTQTLTF